MPLATIFVEIFLKEKNWGGFRPYLVTLWKKYEISLKKNGILKIFKRVNCPGQFSGSCDNAGNMIKVEFIMRSILKR